MPLVVRVNGSYHSYFDTEFQERDSQQRNERKWPSNPYKKIQKAKLADEKSKVPVFAKDIMNSEIHSVEENFLITEALKRVNKFRLHHLIITDSKSDMIGIVSDRDLLSFFDSIDKKVSSVMATNVICCKADTEIRVIVKTMLDEGISTMPVINEDNSVIGVVTKNDLLEGILNSTHIDSYI